MCRFCNVWVCLFVGLLMCGCVCVCVFGFFDVWVFVRVNFVLCEYFNLWVFYVCFVLCGCVCVCGGGVVT